MASNRRAMHRSQMQTALRLSGLCPLARRSPAARQLSEVDQSRKLEAQRQRRRWRLEYRMEQNSPTRNQHWTHLNFQLDACFHPTLRGEGVQHTLVPALQLSLGSIFGRSLLLLLLNAVSLATNFVHGFLCWIRTNCDELLL